MKDRREQPSLDEVIEAYMASTSEPDRDSLAEWMRRYPQYARDLMDFEASRSAAKWLPQHESSAEEEEALALRGVSAVQNILHRRQAERDRSKKESPIIGLMEESKRKGMTRAQFADATELSTSLLAMLDRRLFDFNTLHETVVDTIVDTLAHALDRSRNSIAAYLNGEATFAVAAHRKSDKAPKLAKKQDFFEAVRNDPHISEERRRKWLALAKRG
jgi:hypothetical protein